MTTEELMAKAERVERRPEGDYYILPVDSLTAEQFAELIIGEVKRLQFHRTQNVSSESSV